MTAEPAMHDDPWDPALWPPQDATRAERDAAALAQAEADDRAPMFTARDLRQTAADAVGLLLEFRDQRGYTEPDAHAAALGEVHGGVAEWLDERLHPEQYQPDYDDPDLKVDEPEPAHDEREL